MKLQFELSDGARVKKTSRKFSPILKLARPEDAEEIAEIYLDIYGGTYPYKEMEDVEYVRKLIRRDNYKWLLFKNKQEDTVGCFTYVLDFKKRRGYMRGFNVKKEYQGWLDAVKALRK